MKLILAATFLAILAFFAQADNFDIERRGFESFTTLISENVTSLTTGVAAVFAFGVVAFFLIPLVIPLLLVSFRL